MGQQLARFLAFPLWKAARPQPQQGRRDARPQRLPYLVVSQRQFVTPKVPQSWWGGRDSNTV